MEKLEKALKGNSGSCYDAVVLEWWDISTLSGWNNEHETKDAKPCVCISLGFLVSVEKNQIKLCCGFSDDGEIMDITSYPKGAVKQIIYLTKKKKGKK